MDLNNAENPATAIAQVAGIDHAELENDGPTAHGDRLGTPAPDEKVLWKGRPSLGLLARTAFHTRTLGLYMCALAVIALATGRPDAALVAIGGGVILIALLYFLAWLSARSTLYILTDVRLIMRIGMAIETRINVPLKQVKAAHLRDRGKGYGDIALELNGERLLGYVLLWPHVRPRRYAHPQPMLRAVPEAAALAQLIAEVRARYGEIATNLTEIKDEPALTGHQPAVTAPAAARVAMTNRVGETGLGDKGLEGAPA
ncbi:photosynthetic complex putative assembly protein PuhB [Erythrobacter dokdonensis]|uniref:Putative photosynthetic complex assembly protein n=1 Tax=Erythrobacter dokdonensis DSW-74 TaxID=1300349 RepID=A0A1A7BGS5_9SPHN|nr:photosynthetic complex putative assembly protein PuhB [Erythrobacter dokdonensis]OBV10415.1 putative photosynthetic complex assembly protein [Erythrobacter dokdonensis DSW-74]